MVPIPQALKSTAPNVVRKAVLALDVLSVEVISFPIVDGGAGDGDKREVPRGGPFRAMQGRASLSLVRFCHVGPPRFLPA
jgi:hypothetical protein